MALTAREGADGRIVIQVADTGIGIREDAMARVWKPFEQDDSTSTRRFGGTGLGLAIVHSIVELLGGEVRITSRLGHGTCVTVVLPCAPRPTQSSRAENGVTNG